ncbi:substance-P receptor-like protein [Leptotrombidium deliense]|uniref:Substance-P receptor-like protein n=1 Tax=Leptotrombidium deliense TaxID=299467 RepID=A0A443STJ0_9ACAR|nr:substance-P receptor-like protein [Leptotrombidium deliense]
MDTLLRSVAMPDGRECGNFPDNFTIPEDFQDFDFNILKKLSFGEKLHPKPAWEIAVKSVVLAIIAIIGLIGNYLIIHVVVKFKESRNITNLFISNMAIADLLSILFCAWAALVNDMSTDRYVLGAFYCKFEIRKT